MSVVEAGPRRRRPRRREYLTFLAFAGPNLLMIALFTYRPLLTARRDAVARLEGDAFANGAAKELAKQLKTWSASVGGKPLPLTEANVRAAKPRLFNKLWLIVAGYRASDPRPEAETPAAADLEGDAKN